MSDGFERSIGHMRIRIDGLVYKCIATDKFDVEVGRYISRDGVSWFDERGISVDPSLRSALYAAWDGWRTLLASEGISI